MCAYVLVLWCQLELAVLKPLKLRHTSAHHIHLVLLRQLLACFHTHTLCISLACLCKLQALLCCLQIRIFTLNTPNAWVLPVYLHEWPQWCVCRACRATLSTCRCISSRVQCGPIAAPGFILSAAPAYSLPQAQLFPSRCTCCHRLSAGFSTRTCPGFGTCTSPVSAMGHSMLD
jgi:hypothetical protein